MFSPPASTTLGQLANVALAASKLRQAVAWEALLAHGEDPRDDAALNDASSRVSIAEAELDNALAAIGDEYAIRRLDLAPRQIGGAA